MREYEHSRHCNSHFFGEHYQDLDAALAACAANSGCSGVYDNRCDEQTIQHDSRTTGFVMCDSDYAFEESGQGSCIVTCGATSGPFVYVDQAKSFDDARAYCRALDDSSSRTTQFSKLGDGYCLMSSEN